MDESSLRSVPLFDSLTNDERRTVAQHADEIDVPRAPSSCARREFAYEFFVLEDGTAEVVRDGERVAELGPGDFLGEMGIVSQAVRNATVGPPRQPRDRHDRAGLPLDAVEESRRRERIEAAVEERCPDLLG